MIVVATDGSGSVPLGIAGCGIYVFGGKPVHAKVPPRVITDIKFKVVEGTEYDLLEVEEEEAEYRKPTNNRGELLAIYFAIKLVGEGDIRIVTDSQYSIHCFTGYIKGLSDEDILSKLNGDILLLIKRTILAHNGKIAFKKIKAHQTKKAISELPPLERRYAEMNAIADKYSDYRL